MTTSLCSVAERRAGICDYKVASQVKSKHTKSDINKYTQYHRTNITYEKLYGKQYKYNK